MHQCLITAVNNTDTEIQSCLFRFGKKSLVDPGLGQRRDDARYLHICICYHRDISYQIGLLTHEFGFFFDAARFRYVSGQVTNQRERKKGRQTDRERERVQSQTARRFRPRCNVNDGVSE